MTAAVDLEHAAAEIVHCTHPARRRIWAWRGEKLSPAFWCAGCGAMILDASCDRPDLVAGLETVLQHKE
jgi:hypothetical protein